MSKQDLSFFNTLVKSPELEKSSPIDLSPSTTALGTMVQNLIEKEEVTKMTKNKNSCMIRLLDQLLDYPESSHAENYILLYTILSDRQVQQLTPELMDRWTEKINQSDVKKAQALTANVSDRHLLSLMVLSSRLSSQFMLRKNPEKQLAHEIDETLNSREIYTDLEISTKIFDTFSHFIETNPSLTPSYFFSLLDGSKMHQLYTQAYTSTSRLRAELIAERTYRWLRGNICALPVSYLFNQYTNQEKRELNSDASICDLISESVPNSSVSAGHLLPPTVFSMKSAKNDDIVFDKMNSFLQKLAPQAVQKNVQKKIRDKNRDKNNPTSTSTSTSTSSPKKPILKTKTNMKTKTKTKTKTKKVRFDLPLSSSSSTPMRSSASI